MDNLRRTMTGGLCRGRAIEPGIYLKDFGVRSEVNVFVGDKDAGDWRGAAGPCDNLMTI
jgi:hypothetical protein